MNSTQLIDFWLKAVSYSHSRSKGTEVTYRLKINRYCDFIGQTPEQIVNDYERAEKGEISERTVMRQHNQKIIMFASDLTEKSFSIGTIRSFVAAVMSFYKYNNLTIGKIPLPKNVITYHNRDITRSEIAQIESLAPLKARAYMYVMAQSGLRPITLTKLRIQDLEGILEENTPVPCMITVSSQIEKGKLGEGHPSFICEDSIRLLKHYLSTRQNLTPDSLLFDAVWSTNLSKTFNHCARELFKTGAINYKIREGKPSELRIYNLRKYFRKMANQMGFEHVNYLMNHSTNGSDGHYVPKDTNFYRELYREKAMPFLQIDQPTPTESVKVIEVLNRYNKQETDELRQQIVELNKQIIQITKRMDISSSINQELNKVNQ